jgi:chromosome segregation ATPase
MTNEEFQNTVLQELKELRADVNRIDKKLDDVYEQTAGLMEFRSEVTNRLDSISRDQKSIMGVLGEHEIAIRSLQRRPV